MSPPAIAAATATSTAEQADPADPDPPSRPVRRWRRRQRIGLLVALLLVGALVAVGGAHRLQEITTGPAPSPGWTSWALLDRHTQQIVGSDNDTATNASESMVKAWIAADDLRELAARRLAPDADELVALTAMIRDSDDHAAEQIYARDGRDEVIARMVSICGLMDTTLHHNWWSLTNISARDAVRMGECIADGRAAGPQWTPWVLDQMRQVRGQGRFGIISALPAAEAATVAIKNGWTLHDPGNEWSVNCLAISADWILAVETRYPPARGDLAYGAQICAQVAGQQITAS